MASFRWVLNEFKITSATPNYEDPILSQLILEHISQHQEDLETAESGRNSMFFAAMFGYTEVIKRKITNWKDINAETHSGATALHYAAENGHLNIIKILIHHSAKPITHDHDGWTAMHCAARYYIYLCIMIMKYYFPHSKSYDVELLGMAILT